MTVGGRIKIRFGFSDVQLPDKEASNHHTDPRSSQNWILCPHHELEVGEAVVAMAEKLGSAPGQQPTS